MKICYFGAYDPNYPRNFVIRQGLRKNGVEVIECQIPIGFNIGRRYIELWKKFHRIKRGFSAIIVAEFNHVVMPMAYYFARKNRIPLIFDPFVSFYDSLVVDRKEIAACSIKSKVCFWVDRVSMNLADYLLTDTEEHKKHFLTAFKVKKKIEVIPVGANEELFYPQRKKKNRQFIVLFWGTFIPLHGIEYILKAAKILEKNSEIRVDLVGDGQTFDEMRNFARKLKLINIRFLGFVDLDQLPTLMASADVCLGIFGNTPKAGRVVPHKVYSALAMKKTVITGDTPAIRKHFIHKRHLYLVPMASPEAIAEGVMALKEDSNLRENIAKQGCKYFLENFSTEKIGEKAKSVCLKLL